MFDVKLLIRGGFLLVIDRDYGIVTDNIHLLFGISNQVHPQSRKSEEGQTLPHNLLYSFQNSSSMQCSTLSQKLASKNQNPRYLKQTMVVLTRRFASRDCPQAFAE
jgi:hypothetical protein